MLEELCRSAPEEFQKAVTPGTPENEALSSFFGKLFRLPDELLCFRSYVSTMLDFYFEPLRRRNAEHYAVGVYRFFSAAAAQEALRAALPPYPTFEFLQSRPAMTEYVTMPDLCIRKSTSLRSVSLSPAWPIFSTWISSVA